jgi:uncharacterized membrane protein YidH (DUF202 family)
MNDIEEQQQGGSLMNGLERACCASDHDCSVIVYVSNWVWPGLVLAIVVLAIINLVEPKSDVGRNRALFVLSCTLVVVTVLKYRYAYDNYLDWKRLFKQQGRRVALVIAGSCCLGMTIYLFVGVSELLYP